VVGVSVDDCAQVSQAVSEALEVAEPIAGQYTLEVSSPGFDRILRTREHFERFVGERVAVELKLPIDGRRIDEAITALLAACGPIRN
jgi:ribosome maturation factor RimP